MSRGNQDVRVFWLMIWGWLSLEREDMRIVSKYFDDSLNIRCMLGEEKWEHLLQSKFQLSFWVKCPMIRACAVGKGHMVFPVPEEVRLRKRQHFEDVVERID